MFKKIYEQCPPEERASLYGLLKTNLAVLSRLCEMVTLTLLMSGLGWLIGDNLTKNPDLYWPGAALAIGLMLLLLFAVGTILGCLESRLKADVGLDPRPFGARLRARLHWRSFLAAWVVSFGVFVAMINLEVYQWALISFAAGALWLYFLASRPSPIGPCRPPAPGELSEFLLKQLIRWADKTKVAPEHILIDEGFCPELKRPYLSGLGRRQRLLVPVRALAVFPPRELEFLCVSAVMGSLAGCSGKLFLLRLCATSLGVPLAALLFSALAPFWGFPYLRNPVMIGALWAGAWLGVWIGVFTTRLVGRHLAAQLDAMAELLLKDEASLPPALKSLAERNLEEDDPPAWRAFFGDHFAPARHLKRVRYFCHLAKMPTD